MKVTVKIKSLNEGAVVPFKTYSKDMCYDVVAVSEEDVKKKAEEIFFETEMGWVREKYKKYKRRYKHGNYKKDF